MISFNIPVVMADMPPTPRAAERRKKARCSKILHNRRKNTVLEVNSAPLLSPKMTVRAVLLNYHFAGSEVLHVSA